WWPQGDDSLRTEIDESGNFITAERARAIAAESPLLIPAVVARKLMEAGEPPFAPLTYAAAAVDRTLVAEGRRLCARFLVPPDVAGAYLHIHGGGWCLGSARFQDDRLWRLACEAAVAVVSVEYRLAPEHPHPAGLDDCHAAASW